MDGEQLCVCKAYVVIFQYMYTIGNDQIKVAAYLSLGVYPFFLLGIFKISSTKHFWNTQLIITLNCFPSNRILEVIPSTQLCNGIC